MKRHYILTIINLTFFTFCFGQNNDAVIDSIKKYLKSANDNQATYNLKKSIESANRVIKLSQEAGNEYYQFYAYNVVGINYELISDYKSAEKNYQKALLKAELLKNDTLIGWMYNNLGNVFYEGYKDADKSILFYNKSLELAKKRNDTFQILTPTLNIGWTYIDENEFEKAYPYLEEVISYEKNYGDEELKLQINYLLGKYYVHKRYFDKALKAFEIAIEKGKAQKMYLELSDTYLEQSKLFEILNETSKAFEAYKKYVENKKKVLDKETIQQLEIAKATFALDEFQRDLAKANREKEAQVTITEKSKIITFISIITISILIVLLIILYKNYITKNKLSNMLKVQNKNLEKSKEEAEELSQMKSQFISTVSHELRTPLYGVVGITSLLMEESGLSKKENQYLKSLKFSSDYLLNLINDVLQLSKIDSNKLSLEKADFNTRALLENVVNSFEYHLDQKKNELHLDIEDDVPFILKGDTIRLQQILINLIGNAIKFTDNGDVWLRLKLLKKTDKECTINFQVEDNGIGIPKEKQEEIFDNFLQIERENTGFQGTGLGLSIVKKLITLFGGEIHLESEPNKGSKFCFTLDFKIGKSSNQASLNEKLSKNVHSNNKILIVDDNKINQVVTQNILKKEKFEVAVVDNGLLAIKKIKENHFDLVLMDLNMPVMDGFEATRRIREFNINIPIIALTAVAIDEIKDQVYEAGLNDIINKPYDNQEFYQVILRNINNKEDLF